MLKLYTMPVNASGLNALKEGFLDTLEKKIVFHLA